MLHYTLGLDSPSRHLFSVEITVPTSGESHVVIAFPAWSPGRYYIYDFARNVQELSARGGEGRLLDVEKITKGSWRVECAGEESVTIAYRMFGDTLSGTFSQLDDRHASINGSSVFGYIEGRQMEPIELEINAPEGWRAYTALKRKRRSGRGMFAAANYDVLIDSPIEVGTPIARRFALDGVDYHVIIDIAGGEGVRRSAELRERLDRYVADVEKVVRAYTATFGTPEFPEYYFLVNIDPFAANGDGMEHLASTRLVLNGYPTNQEQYDALVGVTSHEFFHIWNVKRLRPAELGPFDYSRELHTTLLWFAEGFTQYYGHLMLRRAGVWDDKQFYKEMVSEINTVDRSPGRFHRDLRASSFDTWNAVGARSPMGLVSNFKNTYVNYYYKGAVLGLLLDLEIRERTGGRKSLDDLIRELYRTSYAEAENEGYFLRGSGFSERDVCDAAERVGGIEVRRFLEGAITSVDEVDYRSHLRYVGLELLRGPKKGKESADEARPQIFTGIVLADRRERGGAEFVTVLNVLEGSPADRAGISAGDLIIAIDGERTNGGGWESVMGMKRPGETMEITLFRGSRLLTFRLATEERDTRAYRFEVIEPDTPIQRRARKKWLQGDRSAAGRSEKSRG
ncbi:MAG: PDZ domain-containing protein [Candidatus Kapaibacterium sp.]